MIEIIKKIVNEKILRNTPTVNDEINKLFDELGENTLTVKIGDDLKEHTNLIQNIIFGVRKLINDECGFIIPQVLIQNNSVMQENEFRIFISGNCVKTGYLIPTENGIRDEFSDTFKTTIYENLESVFTNEITEIYINKVQQNNSWLIWNLTNCISVIDIKTILVDIINHGKSINNINCLFEKIGQKILSDGKYRDCLRKLNPHKIAGEVAKEL